MKFCYPANDIASYLLTPVQVKLLSDPSRNHWSGQCHSLSRGFGVAGVSRGVGLRSFLFFLSTALPFSPTLSLHGRLRSARSLCWGGGCLPACRLLLLLLLL